MDQVIAYVNPKGSLPEIIRTGNLLVIGSGACVWDDLRRYDQGHGEQDRIAVNDMMAHYPGRLQYGAALHVNKLPGWTYGQALLGAKGGWPPMQVHSHMDGPQVTHVWPLVREGGTVGLFATLIGLLMGYDRIILAGIPCDDSPRFFDPPWQKHAQMGLITVHDEWKRARDEVPLFRDRVRSLSGNTKLWLGEPE
jgi:hypothetical protein